MTKRIYLNNDWKFTEDFSKINLSASNSVEEMQTVRIPHTCKETPLHYFDEESYQMISGYCRELFAPEEWKEKRVEITFEGVAHDCEVFLNGEEIGAHHCGYTAFTVDLSEHLNYGASNTLVVKVDSRESLNIPPFGFVIDYMTYGGIYRDVYLEVKNRISIEDIFVKSNIISFPDKSAEIISEIEITKPDRGIFVKQSLKNKETGEYQVLGENQITGSKIHLTFPVKNVQFWDIEQPNLYEIKTELMQEGKLIDERKIQFGFRLAKFRKDGFYLNEKKVKIRGLNRHQSYPYVGYAMPQSMQRMDAEVLKKELGVNAVRTSHYPQSHYFLDQCDKIGLLVFTEIPGWQHIGDEKWKEQAVENTRDMVKQYRNHTSIILWGVRINESQDDDDFYRRTNEVAHELDDSRPTGGVRAHKKSNLLEDVYTYNDFIHDGKAKGCDKKSAVTSDNEKPYLVSEYNGHMYPTKAFDWEEHRREHAMRHANVLDAVAAEEDIAGSFGWCMFDYNTHKDFGSGDRICYHGVMDMFRNPKLAAAIYACQQEETPVLELSSSMDIGEHPGCNRGETYIFTNAPYVRMYKNNHFIKEYKASDSAFSHLKHGPIVIDDFIGDALEAEHFSKGQREGMKKALNAAARYGLGNLPKSIYATAAWLVLRYHMRPAQAVELYNKYIGDWGGTSTSYRFEAVSYKDEEKKEHPVVLKTITKEPMTKLHLTAKADHYELVEGNTYDVAAIRIQARDENENLLSFFNESVWVETEGPIEIIGPNVFSLQGGMGGTYVKTIAIEGNETEAKSAVLIVHTSQAEPVEVKFSVTQDKQEHTL